MPKSLVRKTFDGTSPNGANPNAPVATGGTITNVGDFRIHTFTSSGTFQITSGVLSNARFLVVGGGGGGGIGGGGAGGFAQGAFLPVVGSYTVTIGAGGTGSPGSNNTYGTDGSSSSLSGTGISVTSTGGGAGGPNGVGVINGHSGASGGGGGSNGGVGGSGTAGQGNAGGASGTNFGGGGGAGAVGDNAGNGGNGLSSDISGSPTFYAGGGGGGWNGGAASVAGLGGGGLGGQSSGQPGANATANTGGGGGGATGASAVGGTGAAGIVIIAYRVKSLWTAPAGVKEVKVSLFRDNTQAIATNGGSSHAIDNAGTLWGWGANGNGQLGDNSNNNSSSPVLVAGNYKPLSLSTRGSATRHMIVPNSDGSTSVYGWGQGSSLGRVGDNQMIDQSSPVLVVGGYSARQTNGASGPNALVTVQGDAYCWGSGTTGRLGDNGSQDRSSPVLVVGGYKWRWVTGGNNTSVAIDSNGDMYGWGDGANGQLGQGTSAVSRSSPVLVVGGLKWKHACAGGTYAGGITVDGDAYCWGAGVTGALGDNASVTDKSSPSLVVGGKKYVMMYQGPAFSVALDVNGDLYAWGANASGQLGDGTISSRSSPTLVLGGKKWAMVTVGGNTVMGATTDGKIYAWGANNNAAIGDNSISNRSSPTLTLGGLTINPSRDILLNQVVVPVTPGTNYSVVVLSQLAQFGNMILGLNSGLTKIVLEYYA